MLTAFSDDQALLASIMAGAADYVLKQIRGCDLVGAVRMVASGRSLLDPRAAGQVMARLRDKGDGYNRLAGLTARERKILELIGDGLRTMDDKTGAAVGWLLSSAEPAVPAGPAGPAR